MASTPDYYPEGWTRERFLEAPDSDLAWSEEQSERFREGLLADVGEEGRDDLLVERAHRQRAKKREQDRQAGIVNIPSTPNFMRTLRSRHFFLDEQGSELLPWGWVVFRTGGYDDADPERVERMKRRWDEIVQEPFQEYHGLDGLDEAKAKFETHWIEGPELKGLTVADIAKKCRQIQVADSLRLNMCLMVNDESIDSILESQLPKDKPRRLRKEIPWCVAVDANSDRRPFSEEEDIEGGDFKGWFRTAVETLVEELWVIVAGEISDLHHIAVGMEDDDIWCTGDRFGIHKAGVGFYDRRGRR